MRSARRAHGYHIGSDHPPAFYSRVDALYHLALATPADTRTPLVWNRTGTRRRIDGSKLR